MAEIAREHGAGGVTIAEDEAQAEQLALDIDKPVNLDEPDFNLLFFGSFTRMKYSEYESAMDTMMSDPNKVYETQIREIYGMGHYLAQRKYKFVLFSYLSFITGILVSSTIYIIGSYT